MDVSEFLDRKNRIAVVGASRNPDKYGFKIFKYLIGHGYNVVPVNPNADEILGQACFNSLADAGKIDVVIVVTKPFITRRVLDQCRELGIKKVWLQPGSEPCNLNCSGLECVHGICFIADGIGDSSWTFNL